MPHNRVLQLLGHLSAHLHIGYFTFLKKTFENGLLHLCGTHLTKTIFLVHHYFQLLQCLHLQVCLNYPNMMLNDRIELYSPPCRISLSLPSDFVVLCTVQVGKQSAFLNIYIYIFFSRPQFISGNGDILWQKLIVFSAIHDEQISIFSFLLS